jgi:hypothetical protein
MNNLVHLKQLDPIFSEYEAFIDKSVGIKTIAFKYFAADEFSAKEYLGINHQENYTFNLPSDASKAQNYFQPELI